MAVDTFGLRFFLRALLFGLGGSRPRPMLEPAEQTPVASIVSASTDAPLQEPPRPILGDPTEDMPATNSVSASTDAPLQEPPRPTLEDLVAPTDDTPAPSSTGSADTAAASVIYHQPPVDLVELRDDIARLRLHAWEQYDFSQVMKEWKEKQEATTTALRAEVRELREQLDQYQQPPRPQPAPPPQQPARQQRQRHEQDPAQQRRAAQPPQHQERDPAQQQQQSQPQTPPQQERDPAPQQQPPEPRQSHGVARPQQQQQQSPEPPALPLEHLTDGYRTAQTTVYNFGRFVRLHCDRWTWNNFDALPRVAQLLVALQDPITGGAENIHAVVTCRCEEVVRWLRWESREDDRLRRIWAAWHAARRMVPAMCEQERQRLLAIRN